MESKECPECSAEMEYKKHHGIEWYQCECDRIIFKGDEDDE